MCLLALLYSQMLLPGTIVEAGRVGAEMLHGLQEAVQAAEEEDDDHDDEEYGLVSSDDDEWEVVA